MKDYITLLLLLFGSTTTFAQANVFENVFGVPFDTYSKGSSIKAVEDGYLFSTDRSEIVKLDQQGEIVWINNLNEAEEYSQAPLALVDDGNYVFVTDSEEGEPSFVSLKKINEEGSVIWTKHFQKDSVKANVAKGLIETNDSNLLLYFTSESFNSELVLIKVNPEGEEIWKKVYGEYSRADNYKVAQDENDNFLMLTGDENTFSHLIKVDSLGNMIWGKNSSGYISFTINNDNQIALLQSDKLVIIGESGESTESIDFEDGRDIISTNDNGYLIATQSRQLIKLDSELNEQFVEKSNGVINHFEQLGNNNIIYAGYASWSNSWVLQTDKNIDYTDLTLTNFLDGGEILTPNKTPIVWYSSGIDEVKISYSTNNGAEWTAVGENIDADSGRYEWEVPFTSNKDALIKIEGSNGGSFIDKSDTTFAIMPRAKNDYISINEVFMWIGNNGSGSHDPTTDGSGFYWPGSGNATTSAVFQDGLVWGGKINGELRVNGNTYRQGLQPGIILPGGEPANPDSLAFKIYKIRKDWESLPPGAKRDRLEYDYNHWPMENGAPYKDIDGNGEYTEGIDKPKFVGDETLFYVANDLDSAITKDVYGSLPIGLEFQTTVFGYKEENMEDVVFKKYKIINKSGYTIEDMRLSYWADNDLGNANDDFVGCDTNLNLAYSWNADNIDEDSYGTPPPAVGHMIVQGPIVETNGNDSAYFGDEWISGFKNLPMTSYTPNFKNYFSLPHDPTLGEYEGTVQMYNLMKGKDNEGNPLINPYIGDSTVFALSGSPVEGKGWYEGEGWPDGPNSFDRRYNINSGPITMVPGDEQEIVIAIFMAKGEDHVNSIAELKEKAVELQEFYNGITITGVESDQNKSPEQFALHQNYPNPFNPETKIKYTVGQIADLSANEIPVTLKIYDILGRKVKTLVNKHQKPGTYKITFNGKNLPSGVYFYRLEAGDKYKASRKMLLLK